MRFASAFCAFFVVLGLHTAIANRRFGECPTSGHNGDLIWQFEVRRNPNLFSYQTAEAQYGPMNVNISCIEVISGPGTENGEATITSGGVGSNHVKFSFATDRGKPMRVRVLVYRRRFYDLPTM
ncbi:uncharacterized protein LOC124408427 [Diprion similis]|uniref:uncharacterized protein LOC124408427 n=1 Tax=Diprion similis TaxID=362088 RepID=UPI001EF8F4F5|nr:uncharacterized protein LOC124408427 [Diprion similis]